MKIEIIDFSPEFKEDLKRLNYEWLEKYFYVEENDAVVLSNPQKYIIDKGGFVFYVKIEDKIVGSAVLMKISDQIFELGKMAVTEKYQGLGIGKKLLKHCLGFAAENKIEKVFLFTDSKLKSAIALYEKYGFKKVKFESGVYERGDVKMEKTL